MRGSLRLRLLGGFSLLDRGAELTIPFSAQRLIAFLAVQRRPLLRSHVAGHLWPDSTEARAAASLRSALWRLQRPGLPLVVSNGSHLRLAQDLSVDVHEVAERARGLLDPSVPPAQPDLDPSLFVGELLPDWWADDWVLVERERLRQLCLHSLEALSERLLELGRHGEAVDAGLAAVRAEPLRESAHRAVISVYLGEGNVGEALRQYRWYERLLWEELGVEPSPLITGLVYGLRTSRTLSLAGAKMQA